MGGQVGRGGGEGEGGGLSGWVRGVEWGRRKARGVGGEGGTTAILITPFFLALKRSTRLCPSSQSTSMLSTI